MNPKTQIKECLLKKYCELPNCDRSGVEKEKLAAAEMEVDEQIWVERAGSGCGGKEWK